jgi:hypothetical protein
MKQVFSFNHISRDLSEDDKTTLKSLFAHYHLKTTCYKMAFKHFTKVDMALNIISIGLTVVGTVVGAIMLNPIVIGVISGSGILLHGLLKLKNYGRKIEMCKFAYTSYQSVLNKIRGCLRGHEYKLDNLIAELNWIDDIVADLCPIVDKYENVYKKKYSIEEKKPYNIKQ